MFRLDPDAPGEDRAGCFLLVAAVVLGWALTLLHLPPASSIEAIQRRYFDAVGFLHTVVLTAGILAASVVPIWLFVRRIVTTRRR